MSFASRIITTLGLVFLAHAGYSAHEHSTLYSNTNGSTGINSSLPLDITLETLFAVILVSAGFVLSAPQLRPVSWSVWAGNIEKEGGAENPFRGLEDRVGFVDIRAKRKEFADWVRQKDTVIS